MKSGYVIYQEIETLKVNIEELENDIKCLKASASAGASHGSMVLKSVLEDGKRKLEELQGRYYTSEGSK